MVSSTAGAIQISKEILKFFSIGIRFTHSSSYFRTICYRMYCYSLKFGIVHMGMLYANVFSWGMYIFCYVMYINIYPRAYVYLHHV